MTLTPLQKSPNNVGNLGKIIVAPTFDLLPKVQKIAQSGHTQVNIVTSLDRAGSLSSNPIEVYSFSVKYLLEKIKKYRK